MKDQDWHWYRIPEELIRKFESELQCEYSDDTDFEYWEDYRTYGDPELVPQFFINNPDYYL